MLERILCTEVSAAEWCICWHWIACWTAASGAGIESWSYCEDGGVEIVVSSGGVCASCVVPDNIDTAQDEYGRGWSFVSKTYRFIELSFGASVTPRSVTGPGLVTLTLIVLVNYHLGYNDYSTCSV
jgi:hypothetical protein